jgi:hypothetical protein
VKKRRDEGRHKGRRGMCERVWLRKNAEEDLRSGALCSERMVDGKSPFYACIFFLPLRGKNCIINFKEWCIKYQAGSLALELSESRRGLNERDVKKRTFAGGNMLPI